MNILYLHGYGSSGQSSTVEFLKKVLPDCHIDAPDIPVDPAEALPFLKSKCRYLGYSIIIGTSMGAMYAQQLSDKVAYRICVNPAFHISELPEILKVGTFDFFQPRKDGQTQFTITEEIIQHFREMEAHQFDNYSPDNPENILCMGLFGNHDTTVNCREEFMRYYSNVQTFEGEHRMNQKVLKNVVLPIINRLENYRREAGLLGELENCANCPEDHEDCLFCQNYGGFVKCGDKPLHFMKRYFVEKEWQRLLKEGIIPQPKEAEPAINVSDEVYGFSPDYRKVYKGKITEIVNYTDKNHYEANISMRPFYGLPVETRIVMDGLFDTPRVSLGIKSVRFEEGKTAERPVDMQIEELPSHKPIAQMVFLDKQSANNASQEYLKTQIKLINEAMSDVENKLTDTTDDNDL